MITLNSLVNHTEQDAGAKVDESKALRYAEDGYRLFIHLTRGLGVATMSWNLIVGTPLYLLPTDWYRVQPKSGRVLDPVGTVVGILSLRSPESPLLLAEPGFIPWPDEATGQPHSFRFTTPQSISIHPTPDATVTGYSITLDYIQEVLNNDPTVTPAVALNPDANLQLSDYLEPGLIAYIASRMSKGAGEDAPLFQLAVQRRKADRTAIMGIGQERTRRRSIW